ncbi:MAG: hypothetical protein IT425_08290 [Pirellulales bacterium]|nr:hypothetical protein [Pirellulales bacterium]
MPKRIGSNGGKQPVEKVNGLRHGMDAMPKQRLKSLFCEPRGADHAARGARPSLARLKNATMAFFNRRLGGRR